jgi:hypothetical protein
MTKSVAENSEMGSLVIFTFRQILLGYLIKNNLIGGECRTHAIDEMCIQIFSLKS